VLGLLLLVLVLRPGPAGSHPPVTRPSAPAGCSGGFRVGFVTDIAGLDSTVDAQGWAGLQEAAHLRPCIAVELLRSSDPASYRADLELLADRNELVIAGSFLLTEAVGAAAADRPTTHFALVDPLLMPAIRPNLAVISVREDQAAFLAGALAAMVSRTKIVGGVYGPEGGAMTRYRHGFEKGAAAADSSVTVLGAYQGAPEGRPFGNPAWGEAQARSFIAGGADVIFGAGGSTGEGALQAAALNHLFCIGAGEDEFLTDPPARACLLTSAQTHPERAVRSAVLEAAAGAWKPGPTQYGIADGAVGLAPFHALDSSITPALRARLLELTGELAAGGFLDGN
jgi:basic membrane protein A